MAFKIGEAANKVQIRVEHIKLGLSSIVEANKQGSSLQKKAFGRLKMEKNSDLSQGEDSYLSNTIRHAILLYFTCCTACMYIWIARGDAVVERSSTKMKA